MRTCKRRLRRKSCSDVPAAGWSDLIQSCVCDRGYVTVWTFTVDLKLKSTAKLLFSTAWSMTVNYASLNWSECEQKCGVKSDFLQETLQQRNNETWTRCSPDVKQQVLRQRSSCRNFKSKRKRKKKHLLIVQSYCRLREVERDRGLTVRFPQLQFNMLFTQSVNGCFDRNQQSLHLWIHSLLLPRCIFQM